MKKTTILLAIAAIISMPVMANQSGGFTDPNPKAEGGFVDSGSSVITVKQAESMRDDSWITLRGNIAKRLSDDDYLFRDSTGTMRVKIDRKHWQGQKVSPSDKVELTGELDKDFSSVKLDVKQVHKIP